jgi:hypothetical protein
MAIHEHPSPWATCWDLSAYGLPTRYDVEIPGRLIRAAGDGCQRCWAVYQAELADAPDGIGTLFLVVTMLTGLADVTGEDMLPETISLIEPPELSAALVAVGAGVRSREEMAGWLAALNRDTRLDLLEAVSRYLVGMASIKDAEAVTLKLI